MHVSSVSSLRNKSHTDGFCFQMPTVRDHFLTRESESVANFSLLLSDGALIQAAATYGRAVSVATDSQGLSAVDLENVLSTWDSESRGFPRYASVWTPAGGQGLTDNYHATALAFSTPKEASTTPVASSSNSSARRRWVCRLSGLRFSLTAVSPKDLRRGCTLRLDHRRRRSLPLARKSVSLRPCGERCSESSRHQGCEGQDGRGMAEWCCPLLLDARLPRPCHPN